MSLHAASIAYEPVEQTVTAVPLVPVEDCTQRSRAEEKNDDLTLVKRFQAGDTSAFDRLVLRYQSRIARVVGVSFQDADMVKDVVQETFLRAYRGLGAFRHDSQFYTWLYRIAINTSYYFLKKGRRFEDAEDIDDYIGHSENALASTHAGPDAAALNADLKTAINRAIARLPQDLKQALVLRELEGMSYEQIAQVMGCRVGTVKSRISRARDQVMEKTRHLYERH